MFTACAGPFTYEDNGSRIEMGLNDTFEVVLSGEANTGYSWRLIKPTSFIKLESPPTLKTNGNSVEYTFNFETLVQGEETIFLVYSNDKEIKKRFEISVVIGTLGSILSD